MTVTIICEVKPSFKFHYKKLAQQVAQRALLCEGFPYEAEIGLTLTDNDGIHQINIDTRGIDSPTDVLSFPMLEYDSPADFSCVEESPQEYINPDTGEVMLGDIVISADKVRSQAMLYGHSEKREYAFLIVHSMLHLMGYDHMTPQEAHVMEERQRKILEDMGITR